MAEMRSGCERFKEVRDSLVAERERLLAQMAELEADGLDAGVIRQVILQELRSLGTQIRAAQQALHNCLTMPPRKGLSELDYGGVWSADDGLGYFVALDGAELWWVGFTPDGGLNNPGLTRTSMFHGKLDGDTIDGLWSDVPRGNTTGHGSLTLRVIRDDTKAPVELQTIAHTGGFTATRWTRRSVFVWGYEQPIQDIFRRVYKNITAVIGVNETLDDNLTAYKSPVVLYGILLEDEAHPDSPTTVNFPPGRTISYGNFMASGNGDGDITFVISVDQNELSRQASFWQQGWSADAPLAQIANKLHEAVECELIMYGRTANKDDRAHYESPPLLPGWAETGGNSILLNGLPLNARIEILPGSSNHTWRLRYLDHRTPDYFQKVRVTGVLANDEPHGPKLEIHPVYAVDVVSAGGSHNLSGAWGDDFGRTYYISEIEDLRRRAPDQAVWWAALGPYRDQSILWAFHGSRKGSVVDGKWIRIPFGFDGGPQTQLSFVVDDSQVTAKPQADAFPVMGYWTKLRDSEPDRETGD